jgi:hypothetical protein
MQAKEGAMIRLLTTRIVTLALLTALTACGREEQTSSLASEGTLTAGAYTCSDENYNVVLYPSANGKFGRVTLSQAGAEPRLLRDFSEFDDWTPAHPSDVDFRARFRNKAVIDDAFYVVVMRGGFTRGVTANVEERTIGTTTRQIGLVCLPAR